MVSSHFDETAQQLLRNSEVNGGLKLRDVFDLVVAGHDDSIEAASVLADKVEQAALLRKSELDELHEWQKNQASRCADEHRKLFEEEIASVVSFSNHDREEYDREVRKRFMSSTTRYVVIFIVTVLLASLAYAFLVRHEGLQADLATGLSSTIAVTMLIWAMLRKDKS